MLRTDWSVKRFYCAWKLTSEPTSYVHAGRRQENPGSEDKETFVLHNNGGSYGTVTLAGFEPRFPQGNAAGQDATAGQEHRQ